MAAVLCLAVFLSFLQVSRPKTVVIAGAAVGGKTHYGDDKNGFTFEGEGWSLISRSTVEVKPSLEFANYMQNASIGHIQGQPFTYYFSDQKYTKSDRNVCSTQVGSNDVISQTVVTQQLLEIHFLCGALCCGVECCEPNYGLILLILVCVFGLVACLVLCLYHLFCTNRIDFKQSISITE